jgi:hypothetical protein
MSSEPTRDDSLDGTGDGVVTLSDWAVEHVPGSHTVAASEPEAVLLAHNLIAVGRSVDAVREVVLEWERIREPDGAVGFVALASTPHDETAGLGADPEHVAGHTAAKVLRGAIPGALIGGAVIALVVLLLVGWEGAVLGALAGGAAFGAVAGAVLSFAMGTGWGAAYTESFVPQAEADLAIASIHGNDAAFLEEAASAISDPDGIELLRVDASGREIVGPDHG